MKKSLSPSLITVFLTTLSLVCYLYLSCAASQVGEHSAASPQHVAPELEQDPKVLLPNVALAKRILNITKIVLPED